MIYLLADMISGVWQVSNLSDENCQVLDQQTFYDCLATLKEGETIGASVDSEYASKIEKEYFISWID